jgi:hypothetical protein
MKGQLRRRVSPLCAYPPTEEAIRGPLCAHVLVTPLGRLDGCFAKSWYAPEPYGLPRTLDAGLAGVHVDHSEASIFHAPGRAPRAHLVGARRQEFRGPPASSPLAPASTVHGGGAVPLAACSALLLQPSSCARSRSNYAATAHHSHYALSPAGIVTDDDGRNKVATGALFREDVCRRIPARRGDAPEAGFAGHATTMMQTEPAATIRATPGGRLPIPVLSCRVR